MKDRMRPVPGNHEYRAKDARPYYQYFGSAAGEAGSGWYSYDLGVWHVIALNSNCEDAKNLCGFRSEQLRWLAADLAANPSRCTLAYWHHPRWSSGKYGSDETVAPFLELLHEAGAEVVLAGHAHSYERFAPMDPGGRPDPHGVRTFVVGTGGSEGSYRWRLVPEGGGRPIDSGRGVCH